MGLIDPNGPCTENLRDVEAALAEAVLQVAQAQREYDAAEGLYNDRTVRLTKAQEVRREAMLRYGVALEAVVSEHEDRQRATLTSAGSDSASVVK